MKDTQDYIKDIAEVRSMMERSSKFLSLSGLSGIMAGLYALIGSWFAYKILYPHPDLVYNMAPSESLPAGLSKLILLAILILILAVGTAIFLSSRNAKKSGEKLWNSTAKRLVINMAVPLLAGGLLILIIIDRGMINLIAPLTLIFYGLALYNASKFTYEEVKSLGLIEIVLGLTGSYFVEYALLCWALGFGVAHIIYGAYMHYRYER